MCYILMDGATEEALKNEKGFGAAASLQPQAELLTL